MHYLYKITNGINGKIYIGQTVDYDKRWSAHKSYAKNPEKTGQYIHRAMAKYGIENFKYEMIASCRTQEDANETESNLIKQYDSQNNGYNVKPGGMTTGHSEETKQKLREATLKQIATKGPPGLGYRHSPEQRARMSIIQQNRNLEYTPEIRKRMSDAHKGKKQPEELVKKRADSIRRNKGSMICEAPDCGIEDRRHSSVIDGKRYCGKHAMRLKSKGTLDARPYNKSK